jgi:hypothetical protein
MNNTGIKCNKCGHFVIINNEGHSECLCDEPEELQEDRTIL